MATYFRNVAVNDLYLSDGIVSQGRTITIPTITANDTFLTANAAQSLSNKTLGTGTVLDDCKLRFDRLLTSTGHIITFPNTIDQTVVSTVGVQTLVNKTLTNPTIASIVNGTGTLTLPVNTTDTIIGRNTGDTLTNKTLLSPQINEVKWGQTTLLFPSSSDTLVGRTSVDALSNKTLVNPNIETIVNADAVLSLPSVGGNDHLVARATVDTLVNKTLTLPQIATIVNGTGVLTLPCETCTVIGCCTQNTMWNKTLVSPILSGTMFSTDKLYLDGTNGRIGVKTIGPPSEEVEVVGNVKITNGGVKDSATNVWYMSPTAYTGETLYYMPDPLPVGSVMATANTGIVQCDSKAEWYMNVPWTSITGTGYTTNAPTNTIFTMTRRGYYRITAITTFTTATADTSVSTRLNVNGSDVAVSLASACTEVRNKNHQIICELPFVLVNAGGTVYMMWSSEKNSTNLTIVSQCISCVLAGSAR